MYNKSYVVTYMNTHQVDFYMEIYNEDIVRVYVRHCFLNATQNYLLIHYMHPLQFKFLTSVTLFSELQQLKIN